MGTTAHELLRDRGLRVTAQRLAVFQAVSDAPHVTADDVVGAVRSEIGWISVQAVYDALAALTEHGPSPVHRMRFVNVRRAAGLEPLDPVQNEVAATAGEGMS